jgi:hypothetical protein
VGQKVLHQQNVHDSFTFVKPNFMLPVGTYKLSLYLENWLPVTSLLARKNSLIDIPGNSSLKALKFLQHCAAVFSHPSSSMETRSRETAWHSHAVRSLPANMPQPHQMSHRKLRRIAYG